MVLNGGQEAGPCLLLPAVCACACCWLLSVECLLLAAVNGQKRESSVPGASPVARCGPATAVPPRPENARLAQRPSQADETNLSAVPAASKCRASAVQPDSQDSLCA